MTPHELIAQTNAYRKAQGLPALNTSPALMQAAANRASDMAKTGQFSHTVATTTGATPWTFYKNQNYNYLDAGENLAHSFDDATSTLKAWQNSPAHNANLVGKNFSDIGVAVVPAKINGKDTNVIVQFFGRPIVQPKAPAGVPVVHAAPKIALNVPAPTLQNHTSTVPIIPKKK